MKNQELARHCRFEGSMDQCLCLRAPVLKITEYYSEAAGPVLSESQKSRGRDEL
jgi:hypothetical protein